ncbi:MAG: DUF3341 domain-containing protein [Pirellulales bacterium]|nr:DUF3341 domain-containing protein [Pirellulales bacterium]
MSAHSSTSSAAAERVAGVLAQYESADALLAAAEKVRDAGYQRWDLHSPHPIHGAEEAMGQRMTVLPWIVLLLGITGAGLGLLLQWWTNSINYPFLISGKPLFSLPAFIPIVFECTILFAAFATFFGMWGLNQLPQFFHPVFASERFRRATSDGFFISVEAEDPKFQQQRTTELLSSAGAQLVETLMVPATLPGLPQGIKVAGVVLTILGLLPPAVILAARGSTGTSPRVHPIQDMDFQPKMKAQKANPLFADGREYRAPVAGTVARGELQADDHFERGVVGEDWAKTFPKELTIDQASLERGRQQFNIYCATCHGRLGVGDGLIARRATELEDPAWVPPLSLHAPTVVVQPVGQLFNSITKGVRKMPPYGSQISTADRWAILLYVRALQRSQNATIDDVPENQRAALNP